VLTFGDFNENVIWLSDEHPTELINLVRVLGFNFGKGRKVKVFTAPEEDLLGELVLVLEVEPHCYVVVFLNPLDLSPKQYLIEGRCLRQLHESKLQLHPAQHQHQHPNRSPYLSSRLSVLPIWFTNFKSSAMR